MIATLLTFSYDNNFDEEAIRNIALTARGKFENMPGLRSKAFTIHADKKQAINFYIWHEEIAARNFFSEETLELVTKGYGVRPSVEYLEVATLVDNHLL
jgi:hypothetical protein